jgi:uncharacterized phage protein (TIGR01671 family)
MREIKFRVYIKASNVMLPVLNIDFVNNYVDVLPEANLEGGNVESVEIPDQGYLMQYTGLRDKNGTEIYEGDILQSGRDKFHVVFWKGCFQIEDISLRAEPQAVIDMNAYYLHDYYLSANIIGDIYQNPELLK